MFSVAPDRPAKVSVKDASTNMIILTVDPPQNNGGVEVIGYRVEYENKIQDFATGKSNEWTIIVYNT